MNNRFKNYKNVKKNGEKCMQIWLFIQRISSNARRLSIHVKELPAAEI